MNKLTTILVAVDFSTGSRTAYEQAVRIATIHSAKVHVLHVVDSAAVAALANSREEPFENHAKVATEGATTALSQWMAQSPAPDHYEVTIALGTPLHEILEHARTLKADLLVAGIAGKGEMPAGAGSISSKLARKVQTPVLLVRTNHPQAFHKIVACLDFSESSRAVVEQAHRVARMDGAEVDFLHVWQEPWVAMAYPTPFADANVPSVVYSPGEREVFLKNLRKELHEFVGNAEMGIESNEVLHEGFSHGNAIAEHAQEAHADLIIIGGKGRTNLRYVLLGSTAERLLTRLPCSLLVVKLPEEK
ncbi:MAG: universal stress protein [Prosthecobacter sp.]|uniref:universal stress protein n=1 Tax=Prosthecobacter sp. TaxID=1965333 RepID=UPI0026255A88|nr:universal stress protein [Prosthecobacter sp.]MCF7790221.1 universal stress protein [Prosthecobacter sp.]